jgi:hypothetical protein
MAFGQPAGPPATAKQVQILLELVRAAGHTDFRDARGPLGLNQRQAAGRFTRDEADEFIAQLQQEAEGSDQSPVSLSGPSDSPRGPSPKVTAAERSLKSVPSDVLAAELQRRGWVVLEP